MSIATRSPPLRITELETSISLPGAMLVGVVNAVGGGVLRSVLHRTPEVFRPGELTALAAFGGTLAYAGLAVGLHLEENFAGMFAIGVVAAINLVSRRYRVQTRAAWRLPKRAPQRRKRRAAAFVTDGHQ